MEDIMINAKTACYIFAAAFIAAGILGFIPNPLVAPDGLFAVNAMHNIVHILTGVVFAAGAMMLGQPRLTLQVMGAVYAVVALLGFVTAGDMLLGLVRVNTADDVLHLIFAIALLGAGFGLPQAAKAA